MNITVRESVDPSQHLGEGESCRSQVIEGAFDAGRVEADGPSAVPVILSLLDRSECRVAAGVLGYEAAVLMRVGRPGDGEYGDGIQWECARAARDLARQAAHYGRLALGY